MCLAGARKARTSKAKSRAGVKPGRAAGCGAVMRLRRLQVVVVAIVLGIIGVVAMGLFYLLVIGVMVLLADFVLLGLRLGRRRRLPR